MDTVSELTCKPNSAEHMHMHSAHKRKVTARMHNDSEMATS